MQKETRINILISLATVLVLGVTLAATLWIAEGQSKTAELHNSIVVRPYLDAGMDLNPQDSWTAVHLRNDGPGPAQILWAEVRLNGRRPSNPRINGWEEFRESFPLLLAENNVDFLAPGEIIGANESKTLIRIRVNDADLATRTAQRDGNVEFLKSIQYVACYCSLYDECWTFILRMPGDRETNRGCSESPAAIPTLSPDSPSKNPVESAV